jgi:hypothetical protein
LEKISFSFVPVLFQSPPTTPIGQSASSAAGNQATGSSGGKSKPKKKKRVCVDIFYLLHHCVEQFSIR